MKIEEGDESDDEASNRHVDWGLLSGLLLAVKSVGRKPVHGEVVDLQVENLWGVSFHVGWGVMWRKRIITKEHIVVLDNPTTDIAVTCKTGIPPLTVVKRNDLVYSLRVVCGWTTYYVRDTYRSRVLEVGNILN